MLTEPEFLILNALLTKNSVSQRDLAEATSLSLGTINSTLHKLHGKQLLDGLTITQEGMKALEPHKVDNAIIMAAGMSSRFAPLSYERPKGTLLVRGEVLIERIIRQLQEVGITDITVVVGYMKEQFLYLEDAFDIKIVVSEWYAERNNHSTLYLIRKELANTFVVASDYYFVENPFEPYVYHGYYAAIYYEGYTKEHFLTVGTRDRITRITVGGTDGWGMYGHTYFDRQFSDAFSKILEDTFHLPETRNKLWEDLYADHVRQLDLKIRRYPANAFFEFDSLDEVSGFDPDFVTNIDSEIFTNIESILTCERNEICDIAPLEEGLTNLSFYFRIGEEGYVYRHPGIVTRGLLDRAVEERVENIAYKLGLDRTFIHLDPEGGWKLSKFIQVSEQFDYHDTTHLQNALQMIHKLHDSGLSVASVFDVHGETDKIKKKMSHSEHLQFHDFRELDERADRLYELASAKGARQVLSHNDFCGPNILVREEELFLIDWEYSGMCDYAHDLGTFICCSDYTYEEALLVLEQYFGRALSPVELAHCVAYVSLSSYYWFVWALHKEAEGEGVGEWLYRWYRAARDYGKRAEKLFCGLL